MAAVAAVAAVNAVAAVAAVAAVVNPQQILQTLCSNSTSTADFTNPTIIQTVNPLRACLESICEW